ncbi:hypothetical protein SGFS_013570 [Streptomyces graminofaciens]|uniref:Uncharacterized protein n=1 Tax=Streptomyces graminofaciens TaxID=68212 RepID=A0ABN5VAZ3_9ACTN|nr:hypothetical protein [Streptomyces graminofaciens]BBC30063.1 hypothetical protein SGFS_013570 [Streptomyces graminofaciens]
MLHTEELPTCPILGAPDNYHFEGHCEDCDIKTLSRLNLGQVEDRYHDGRTGQGQFEAYMHVWATLSPHKGRAEWRETPKDPDVRRIARKLLAARHFEIPADLIDVQPASFRPAA